MQHTILCDGPNGPPFPAEVPLKDVNVYLNGIVATHDYSCPVCREKSAVLDMTCGVMQPCWNCQTEGWEMTKKKLTTKQKIKHFYNRICHIGNF